ncbi:MAG TPA: hypothetical protein VLQ79_08245, partial [Myxococcaceae bacterium]|nr:hypothetical protein [Myxococcaceae bacterium]
MADAGPDAGSDAGTDADSAGNSDAGPDADRPTFTQVPGWSLRRRMRATGANDVALEEQLTSFTVLPFG